MGTKEHGITLLGFDLSGFDRKLVLGCSIFVSFFSLLAYALLQEKLVKVDGLNNSWFLLFFSSFFFCVAALLDPKARATLFSENFFQIFFDLAPIGFALCIERGLRNLALQQLDFVTLVICQSAKAIPVLFIGKFMFNRSFSFLHYLNALCVAASISIISLADSQNSGTFSALGVVLILSSVTAEALKAVFSEVKVKNAGYSPCTVILWSNLTGFLLAFPICIMNDSLVEGVKFLEEKPSVIFTLVIYCAGGFFGTLANVLIMALADAYLCTIQGSLRKTVIILISAIRSGKEMVLMHYLGIMLSIGALFMTTLLKKNTSNKKTE
uniref:Sugar phosphate transporter domain-containing protein n=1 Tax=Paramoeba aestuarina TaxID=180227 RepID=A0A7S4L4V3_9EUKA|mmetsp:Transcript_31249/g.48767  ORF Transcript_31249/g.48767 Transcript_31249/m.48767 type:complete len:325 (+) Transcript_31249:48-1022(+)